MLDTNRIRQRAAERGNVLFLILIAVALFAALSYAVTQSSRSGGGSANDETNLISSATVTQYPASIRTAIIRMMVSNSVDTAALSFNPPSDFDDCTDTSVCVFHPDGGGATFVAAPADVVEGDSPQPWVFSGQNEVALVGTTGGGDSETVSTVDIMAILPNVDTAICSRINSELGIGASIPPDTGIDIATNMGNANSVGGTWQTGLTDNGGGTIGEGGASALNGQAFGCFSMGGHNYYYHVLIEQ